MNVTTDKRAQALRVSAVSGTLAQAAIAPELAPSDLLFAMTTEHSTLQAARSATIFETGVRATLFLGAVSGGLVALAFLSQVSGSGAALHVFAVVVLPVLLILGVLTHMRLVELAIEDVFYGRAINRIRHYYLDLAPDLRPYFLLSGSDDLVGVAANTGRRHTRWHFVSHAATTVLVVTAVLAGSASAVALHIAATPPLFVTAVIGATAAVGVAVTLLRQQSRTWARADANVESIFPSSAADRGMRGERGR